MGFNKGEWSELYTFLYLLTNPNIEIVDEHLKLINQDTFYLQEIYVTGKTTYRIANDKNITKIFSDGIEKVYPLKDIISSRDILLEKIQLHKKAKGSFEIQEIEPLINSLLDGKKLKGSSRVKGDLEAKVFDNKQKHEIVLKYNIKSNLGSRPTLLNASSHTNFIYEVTNITDDVMHKNNTILTRTKLIDRCRFLHEEGASIQFIGTQSRTFGDNLKLIDSNLDTILAQMLLLSYEENEKDIKKLLTKVVDNKMFKESELFYQKKIGDFANAVTFGMRASEVWSGENEVNGGIIIVTKKGEVYLLDLVYYKSMVDKYLIDNIKLESPSFSRYKMFEIYKDNGKYYFKLNLQVRFKK
ncbi:MAG: HpaII family restriction endonuclease [Epsilonproteobacteria bacterium]|nr:HpaII family restriction endonuclease [Campylobacterota bacterium]